MRKSFAAAAVALTALLAGCGKGTPKADLNNEQDTLAYAFGMTRGDNLKEYLVRSLDMDTTYMDEFIKGLSQGMNADDDKKKEAYLIGMNMGMQVKNELVKGLNYELFGDDTTRSVSINNMLAGLVSGATKKDQKLTSEEAGETFNRLLQKIKKAELANNYAGWKKENEDFLAQVAQGDSIKKLADGLYYEVIEEGTGEVPVDTDRVQVHYEGQLIDGTEVENSYKRDAPLTFRVNEVIPGWTEALVHMPVGSKWKLYVGQQHAYGEREVDENIKPFSTLVFTLELLGIENTSNQVTK
ncbi:MAG: FKBP-type peptidyl-prolyl cis-trans isomerase [Bacteroidaceae bacterium]|nr:FKBP-type peptidyl-prolyl cis-trans isomerase [Bacteroidaceae bacterium]